jgi:creatinine amidohydrolase
MASPLRLKEMTPSRAALVLAETHRLLIPAGTLEARGPHLPLGCDTVILDRLADDLSSRTGIPRAPTLEYGVHATPDHPGSGTAALTRKTLHRAVNELIAVWEEVAGVRDTLILTAHAADQHLEALSTIRTIGRVRVADILALECLGRLKESPAGPWHGGEVDTSLMLYLAPALVDHSLIPPSVPASMEKGRLFYEAIVSTLVTRIGEPDSVSSSIPLS